MAPQRNEYRMISSESCFGMPHGAKRKRIILGRACKGAVLCARQAIKIV
jgi:hypothetical protein